MNRSSAPIAGYGLAGVSGLALILIMFLFAWYTPKGVTGVNGFDAFDGLDDWIDIILVFTAFAGMALALVGPTSLRVELPVALSALVAGLGAISTLLLIVYLFATPSISLGGAQSVDTSLKLGEVLGLIASAGVAAGGWLAMQEEGTSVGAQADRLRDRTGGGAGAGPPSPQPPSGGPPPPSGP
jgi:hypothetical protein